MNPSNNKISFVEHLKKFYLFIRSISKKRNKLILLGAGAAIDIGGPLTICDGSNVSENCCLTHLTLSCGIFITPHVRLTTSIYWELKKYRENPTFEDILDFVEKSIISTYNHRHNSYSNYYKFLDENLKITIKEDKITINSYCNINFKLKTVSEAYSEILNLLLTEIIVLIKKRIKKYEDSINLEFNNKFNKWFEDQILYNHQTTNIYSLNYDNYLFKHILIKYNNTNLYKPNRTNPVSSINYYNLHGSIHWKISETTNNRSYQIDYCDNIDYFDIQVKLTPERNELLSPIISGKEKVNKIFAEPFQNIVTSFRNDSVLAHDIYIIGYSFLDIHINEILRKALEKNPQVKIIVVNPGMYVQDFIDHIYNDLKHNYNRSNKHSIFSPLNNSFEIEGSSMRFFKEKFIDYLINPHSKVKLINANLSLFEQIKQRLV